MEDDAIRTLVTRLARPKASGGHTIDVAAILAEGADYAEVMTWITAHDGEPEASVAKVAAGGLHGSRFSTGGSSAPPAKVRRFTLPPGALS